MHNPADASFFRRLLFFAVSGLFVIPVGAATLEVDDDGGAAFTTIQAAIDAAVPGVDDVFVHCGVYVENVVLRDDVDVTGANTGCAIIDGNANGTSVVTALALGSSTVLQGFTIRNGVSSFGGGIYIENGSPVITNNVIEGNSAVASGAQTGYGGGIHVTAPGAADPTVTAPTITRNVIRDNAADEYGGGIELVSTEGVIVSNNVIENNTAGSGGGGIDAIFAFPTLVNNTVVNNCKQGAGTACSQGGGGILLTDSGVVQLANNVIAWNESAIGGGGLDIVGSLVVVRGNDSFANTPVNYSGLADPTGVNGNISIDPLFVGQGSAVTAFEPRSDSPLIDAAVAALAPSDDLRGIGRPVDGDADGTAVADIGARENEGVTRLRFSSKTDIEWDASIDGGAEFNLYRGDLQTLLSTGIYNQNPATIAGARQWCGLLTPSAIDNDEPDLGQTFEYLAVIDGAVEGGLGFDSSLQARPFTNPAVEIDAARCP